MADKETDPDGICPAVMAGLRALLEKAVDKAEAALDYVYEVLDDINDVLGEDDE